MGDNQDPDRENHAVKAVVRKPESIAARRAAVKNSDRERVQLNPDVVGYLSSSELKPPK